MQVDGIYTGLNYDTAPLYNDSQTQGGADDMIYTWLSQHNSDTVVSVYMRPRGGAWDNATRKDNSPALPKMVTKTVNRPVSIDGYTNIKNNKLLTAPFCSLCIDTGNDTNNYKFEYSKTPTTLTFHVYLVGLSNPSILVVPVGYNGTATGVDNVTESVECSGFPQCALTIDSYRAWLAQRSNADRIKGIGMGAAGIASIAASAHPIAAGALAAIGLAQHVNSVIVDQTQNTRARGVQNASPDVATRLKAINAKIITIKREQAEIIDGYFTKFGYACCKIKTPNRNVRERWTYTKTQNIDLRGAVPTDAMNKIKDCYNNGIRFWKSFNEVGNYSLSNNVL